MTDYVWLIGGSIMSKPMCTEIKRRGYKLFLTDGNPDCVCRSDADIFHAVNVYDEEANLKLAKTLTTPPSAVLCIGCDAGPTVSLLSNHFFLPSIGYYKAKQVKDKAIMRGLLQLPHPRKYKRDDDIVFPCVVKARHLAGSKGFRVIANEQQLADLLADTPENELSDSYIEEFLIGKDLVPEWRQYGFDTSEVALDYFVWDGKTYYANGALRLFWDDMPGIEAGHINPFEADQRINDLAQYVAERLGITWGVLKLDLKSDKRYSWCVLECATRLSGGFDHMITSPMATGRDVTGAMLDLALGEALDFSKLSNKFNGYACALAPRFPPGRINGWSGIPIQATIFDLTRGEIKPLKANQDRPLFIIRQGQTMNHALVNAMDAAERIKPKYV